MSERNPHYHMKTSAGPPSSAKQWNFWRFEVKSRLDFTFMCKEPHKHVILELTCFGNLPYTPWLLVTGLSNNLGELKPSAEKFLPPLVQVCFKERVNRSQLLGWLPTERRHNLLNVKWDPRHHYKYNFKPGKCTCFNGGWIWCLNSEYLFTAGSWLQQKAGAWTAPYDEESWLCRWEIGSCQILFGDFVYKGTKELVPFTQLVKVRRGQLVFTIPDICHGSHGYIRVIFFWQV